MKKQPEVRTARRWLPRFKEDAWNESSSDPLDETVNRWVELGEGGQLVGRTARDHQVGLCVELIAPQPRRPEGLLLKVWPKVVMKSAREHKDTRSSPTERHDGNTLVGRAVNTCYNNPASEDRSFSLQLNLVKIGWGVAWPSMGSQTRGERRS